MPNIFDLHMHTTASDGCFLFEQLISYMKNLGIEVIAITDHDILSSKGNVDGIVLVPGVEITTSWSSNSEIHILGLNLKEKSSELDELLEYNRNIRRNRAEIIDYHLEKFGYPGSLKYIVEKYSPQSVGRLHFARFLKDRNYAKNIGEAFKNIIMKINIKDKFDWPNLEEVIRAIQSAKGQSIIAHPLKYGFKTKEINYLIKTFSELNGDGIEFISGNMTYKEMKLINELSKPYGLLASMGSDFHVPRTNKVFNASKYSKWLNNFIPVWLEWDL